jgi:hypothetical protein
MALSLNIIHELMDKKMVGLQSDNEFKTAGGLVCRSSSVKGIAFQGQPGFHYWIKKGILFHAKLPAYSMFPKA